MHPHSYLRRLALSFLTLSMASCAALAQAPLRVEGAWARVSVPGQNSSGAFMQLTASEAVTLLGGSSPVAGAVEVHEMRMDGDVMRMRALDALPLPAGKSVALRPGGLHLMLLDLKAPLQAGTRIPVTLLLRDAKGTQRRLELQVPVSASAPGAAGAGRLDSHGHGHGHGHGHDPKR